MGDPTGPLRVHVRDLTGRMREVDIREKVTVRLLLERVRDPALPDTAGEQRLMWLPPRGSAYYPEGATHLDTFDLTLGMFVLVLRLHRPRACVLRGGEARPG